MIEKDNDEYSGIKQQFVLLGYIIIHVTMVTALKNLVIFRI